MNHEGKSGGLGEQACVHCPHLTQTRAPHSHTCATRTRNSSVGSLDRKEGGRRKQGFRLWRAIGVLQPMARPLCFTAWCSNSTTRLFLPSFANPAALLTYPFHAQPKVRSLVAVAAELEQHACQVATEPPNKPNPKTLR